MANVRSHDSELARLSWAPMFARFPHIATVDLKYDLRILKDLTGRNLCYRHVFPKCERDYKQTALTTDAYELVIGRFGIVIRVRVRKHSPL
jgi:hypothetical protein